MKHFLWKLLISGQGEIRIKNLNQHAQKSKLIWTMLVGQCLRIHELDTKDSQVSVKSPITRIEKLIEFSVTNSESHAQQKLIDFYMNLLE